MKMTREQFNTTNLELRNKRLELIEAEEATRLKEKELEALSSNFMSDIASALDPETSKPMYGNAEKRAAELAIRQTNSADWTQTDEELSALRRQVATLRVDISFLSNDIQYGINHVSDEIESHIININNRLGSTIDLAVYTALKEIFTGFSFSSQGKQCEAFVNIRNGGNNEQESAAAKS